MGATAEAHSYLPGISSYVRESALDRQPTNTNFLLPTSFQFDLKRTPAISFFCQSVNIPSVSLGEIEQPTRFSLPVKRSGETFTYDDLEVEFVIDEDMKAWTEIYNWMTTLTAVESFKDYRDAKHGKPPTDELNHYSDASLLVTNSAKVPILNVKFEGVFPKTLSNIPFTSTVTDTEPIVGTVTFGYTSYEVETL
jgi:hypothetical protein